MIKILAVGIVAFLLFGLEKIVFARYWDRDLNVKIKFGNYAVTAGNTGQLTEVIENGKWLPLSALNVKFNMQRGLVFDDTDKSLVTDKYYRNELFQINGNEKITRTLKFTAEKRGYYTIDEADVVTVDLFMDDKMVMTLPQSTELYVYPKPFSSDGFIRTMQKINGEILAKRHLLEDPFEYRGIREYQPYDDMKHINWKATACTGQLQVNQHNYTMIKAVRIFINIEDTGILKKEKAVEACISVAAGLCENFISQGFRVSCYCNGADVVNGNYLSISANAGVEQLVYINQSLARLDMTRTVYDFSICFEAILQVEAKDSITIFIAPNQYEGFLETLRRYGEAGYTYFWIYPTEEKENPQLASEFMEHVNWVKI